MILSLSMLHAHQLSVKNHVVRLDLTLTLETSSDTNLYRSINWFSQSLQPISLNRRNTYDYLCWSDNDSGTGVKP